MTPVHDEAKAENVKAALVHESLLSKVRVIRERRGGNIADVLTRFGGPGIDREWRRVLDEMQAEAAGIDLNEAPAMANDLAGEGA